VIEISEFFEFLYYFSISLSLSLFFPTLSFLLFLDIDHDERVYEMIWDSVEGFFNPPEHYSKE
jgi:hypothetical protein